MDEIIVKKSFKDALLDTEQLSVTWELVPGRGVRTKSQEYVIKMAKLAAKDPRINAVTLTDSPGGKAAILAYPLAVEVKQLGIEPIVHFTCKDKNRNALESELYALSRSEIQNILVLTGDYPAEGLLGKSKPIFDLDAVHTLELIEKINHQINTSSHEKDTAQDANLFFPGAVISPFKSTEGELLSQYHKLHKKINSGAKFIITQLGYDARKFDELRKYMDLYHPQVPLVGNIFVLSLPVAKVMNKNRVPGCVVTDALLSKLAAEESQNSCKKEGSLLRAAKLYAVLKGLKYNGVNIGGHGLDHSDIQYIIAKGEELAPQWQDLVKEFDYPQQDGFYFFEKDESTGLNSSIPVNRIKTGSANFSLRLSTFHLIHRLFFDHKSPFFPLIRFITHLIDHSALKKAFTSFEYIAKTITNECHFCGDCVMHELEFICPMSQCPKQQRNGACGGSRDGWCEVYPGQKKCIYVQIYEARKRNGQEGLIKDQYFPPCNYALYKTSSWLNYFKS